MRKVLVFTSIFILMSIHLFSEDDLSFSGYYKSFATAFVLPVYRLEEGTVKYPDIGALNNRIRLRLLLKSGNKLSFNFAYDFSPRIQDPSLFKVMVIIVSVYFVACMFVDPIVAIFVFSPIFAPYVVAAGVDPIVLGVLVTLQAAMGSATPPFGCDIFTGGCLY